MDWPITKQSLEWTKVSANTRRVYRWWVIIWTYSVKPFLPFRFSWHPLALVTFLFNCTLYTIEDWRIPKIKASKREKTKWKALDKKLKNPDFSQRKGVKNLYPKSLCFFVCFTSGMNCCWLVAERRSRRIWMMVEGSLRGLPKPSWIEGWSEPKYDLLT